MKHGLLPTIKVIPDLELPDAPGRDQRRDRSEWIAGRRLELDTLDDSLTGATDPRPPADAPSLSRLRRVPAGRILCDDVVSKARVLTRPASVVAMRRCWTWR